LEGRYKGFVGRRDGGEPLKRGDGRRGFGEGREESKGELEAGFVVAVEKSRRGGEEKDCSDQLRWFALL